MNETLEKFGAFVVRNFRDKMFFDLEMLLRGGWKAESLQELQQELATLTEAQKQLLWDLVGKLTTGGMHDFLFAIQEEADRKGAIKVLVDGEEVAKLSDGLHGEIFGKDGWIVRHSKYPAPEQIELSRLAEEEIRKMMEEKGDDDAEG